MERFDHITKINFKEKQSLFKKLTNGQKFLMTIKKLFEQNKILLNSEFDENPECLDLKDFSKDFRYNLKSDGARISEFMDNKLNIETDCKKISVDGSEKIVLDLIDQISKICVNF